MLLLRHTSFNFVFTGVLLLDDSIRHGKRGELVNTAPVLIALMLN